MERNRRNPSFKKRPNPNTNKGRNKRGKFNEQSSTSSKASETVYKILCQTRKIGSVLGKGGGIIKSLRQETQAKITVSDSVPGSEERVIIISSPSSMPAKSNTTNDNNQDNSDMELHCAAQDALLKVHDRIIEEDIDGESAIMARLLVPNNTVGCILGKKGDVITRLRSETGASIRVMPGDQRPACAMPTDELVQILAKPDVAKGALYQVSTLLHQNPRKDKPPATKGQNMTSTNLMRPERGPSGRGEPPMQWMGPTRFGPNGVNGDFAAMHDEDIASEFSMKILCSSAKIGGLIGQGGLNVRQLQQATRTNILVDDASVASDDRVIRVSAFEASRNPRSQTIDAVLNIQDITSEQNGKGVISTRLLIPSSKVGCIIGQGGQVINEMRRRTKADIRVFPKEERPKCAGEDEELVQVSGSYNYAKDAVSEIALRYRARCLRDAKPGEPSTVGPVPGFVPLISLINEGPPPSGVTLGGPPLGYQPFQGGGREYEPLSYPAPSREYGPHGYPVPPRSSGYPGVVDVKISNSGQIPGMGYGVHNINEVQGTVLKPQDPYAVGVDPVSEIPGSTAAYQGVNVYQGYGSSSVQNHPLHAAYNNYGTQQVPFSDMNSSLHVSYHTTTTATTAATTPTTTTTDPQYPPYPPQQVHYPESAYQYGQ